MFKYFNPVWIIENFLQPSLGPEILIPAAIGAVGSSAMGGNPIKGALLGAATGGILGGAGGATAAAGTAGQGAGAGLIGGANLSTAGGVGIGSGASGGLGSFLSNIKGIETAPVNFGTGGYASGIGGQAIGSLGPMPAGQSLDEILEVTIPRQNLANITSPEAIANSAFPKFEASGFSNLGVEPTVSVPFSTEAFTNNPLMAQQIANNAGQTVSPSFFDNMGLNKLSSYVQQNPMVALSGGQSILNIRQQNEAAEKQRLRDAIASVPPIRQGQAGPMAGNLLQVRRIG